MSVGSVPFSDHSRSILSERNALRSRGHLQLQHNEFMLHDRNKWPNITLPGTTGTSYSQQAMVYPNNVMAQMSRNHHPGYVQNPQVAMSQTAIGQSPSKRARHGSVNQGPGSSTAIATHLVTRDSMTNDEETSISIDYMDAMTPREISVLRYVQHHEWLEEILSSPYETYQIIPGELGLGRKGELESLTKDFFRAHTDQKLGRKLEDPDEPKTSDYEAGIAMVSNDRTPRVGRMANGKADDFQEKAAQRINRIRADVDAMKAQHSARMERLKTSQTWKQADQDLRTLTSSLVNGKASENDRAQAEEMVQDLARKVGKQIRPLKSFECIEKGGLEDKTAGAVNLSIYETNGSTTFEDGDKMQEPLDAAGLFTPDPSSDARTGNQTPVQADSTSPQRGAATAYAAPAEVMPVGKDQGGEDWIMVDREESRSDHEGVQAAFDGFAADTSISLSGEADETADLVEEEEEQKEQDATDMTFGENDFNGGLDFSDFNTAGPDLDSYAQEIETMGVSKQKETNNGASSISDDQQISASGVEQDDVVQ